MSADIIPNEAVTEFLTADIINGSASIQAFMDGCLTAEEKRRFTEIAHHLVYMGFTNGQQRPDPQALTVEQHAKVGIHKLDIMNEGAAIARDL